MTENHTFITAIVAELSRRKVLRTMGGYAVAAFAVLQLMDAAVEPLRLPDWVPTLVVLVVILGFPVAFMLAWQLEITSGGIRKTSTAGLLSRAQSSIMFSAMLAATGALGFGLYQYYAGVFEEPVAQVESARAFAAPDNSIAVLPFADLSENGDQVNFSDGVAEEILNLLAQVDGLHVAARTSSFAFRGLQSDIREIGRLLNVRTVLEGSIRKAGNRIRLTAQLINVEDGYHIWSQSYDRELDDVFAIQDDIASAIAAALVDSFAGLTAKPASRAGNLAAFEAFRTGRLHWWRRSPQEIQKAIEYFARALEHDPQFAPAYAAIADSALLLSSYGNITLTKAVERAQPMIEKALEIDPESAEAFAALGLARWQIGQTDSAESALRQAITLNEDYIPARLWLGGLLGQLGRVPEQGLVLQEAMALDPLNELLAINYAGNLYVQGDFEGGREMLDRLVQLRPDSTALLRTVSTLAFGHGDLVDAWNFARRAYEIEPDSPVVVTTMARAWMELGEFERAEAVLVKGLEAASDNADLNSQYYFTLLMAGRLEDADRAVREYFGDDVDSLPKRLQRYYYFQKALISAVTGDMESAVAGLEQAIGVEDIQSFDGDHVFMLTMASALNVRLGNADRASEQLQTAERWVRRARINGVDEPEIHYAQSSIYALQGDRQRALETLHTAYEKGFRQRWMLKLDKRMDAIRDDPQFIEIENRIIDDMTRARAEVLSQQLARL